MKTDVGLIGNGIWGSKIKSNLIKIANLKFVCNSSKNYLNEIKKNKVKWVFIATPNKTHYEIVKNCLNKGINVYCEKPLCLSHLKAKKLVELSKKKKIKTIHK
jgi:predicted dehydrogenase